MEKLNYNKSIALNMHNACRGCKSCNGFGCRGEVPGMGGQGRALTFINNYKSWNDIDVELGDMPELGVAPMTGVGQNMGNVLPEAQFHDYMVAGAKKAGIFSSIGDGTPDFKLLSGISAFVKHNVIGTSFIKPYSNKIIIDRFKLVEGVSNIIGVDIDSHHIPTMKGLASLEKKSSAQLLELKKNCPKRFIIKGVQSMEDFELIKSVKPDIVVVSNHGGRVFDNGVGIAYRLQELMPELKKYTGEVWVDGGLRTKEHLRKAHTLGASRVLIGRPLIQAVSVWKEDGVPYWLKELK